MKITKTIVVLLALLWSASVQAQVRSSVKVLQNENWWVGIVFNGHLMPLTETFTFDMARDATPNQLQPLLVSDRGRYIFSESPVKFTFRNDSLLFEGDKKLSARNAGSTLREAYLKASGEHFAFNGKYPHEELFKKPQYNTWIELGINQNQKGIIQYAQTMLDNGMPPGVLMIDDTWQQDYGVWNFDKNVFPDASAMMDTLHAMGFKVMLWICPFVSPDSREYRLLEREGGLLLEQDSDRPKMVRWWNGVSAVLDLSHPNAVKWFKAQLDRLQQQYGADGFKFDAGDTYFYFNSRSYGNISVNEHCRLFNEIGLDYPLNEYRAAWKMGGAPLAHRLQDKGHNWEDLQLLIPHIVLQGLMGYPYNCPDMIGGGEMGSFLKTETIDQELVVRSTQCHVFTPMMQFSVNPFRILDEAHASAVKEAVALRQKFVPVIMELVENASKTGEPVVRSMEYVFPHQGYAAVTNQFLLGDKYLIAPVLEKNALTRKVLLPKGKWKDANGKVWNGGREVAVKVNLSSIPYFEKL
ncbi:putative alpha-glucosidase II [Flammeovirgaceae bacterium 311]|nr:putative alpha-glucosidase II [Flammeovirgaceae bacterium 311]